MPAPATAPAPFRNCVAKVVGVPPIIAKKTSSEKNHPHKNTRTVPNRNGWLQEEMEGKFLSKHTINKCQNTLQASQAEPLPPSERHRNPKNDQKCMSEQILTPNSTGGGIPTPVTKTNSF